MKSIVEYVDDLKAITGSDYRTAKLLEVSRESISHIRSRGKVCDDTAVKMAELLGIDAAEVLLSAAIARSEGQTKKAWEHLSKISGIAASILFTIQIVMLNLAPKIGGIVYIMLNRRKPRNTMAA